MGQERLLSLALMHIHYQVKIEEAGARHYSEGLVPQYFDVPFYIVKLVLYNLIQTVEFDKCNIQFLTGPHTLLLRFFMYHHFPV